MLMKLCTWVENNSDPGWLQENSGDIGVVIFAVPSVGLRTGVFRPPCAAESRIRKMGKISGTGFDTNGANSNKRRHVSFSPSSCLSNAYAQSHQCSMIVCFCFLNMATRLPIFFFSVSCNHFFFSSLKSSRVWSACWRFFFFIRHLRRLYSYFFTFFHMGRVATTGIGPAGAKHRRQRPERGQKHPRGVFRDLTAHSHAPAQRDASLAQFVPARGRSRWCNGRSGRCTTGAVRSFMLNV